MLLQGDGSRHDWLEGRGPWLTLVGYIDDATSEVCGASFRAEEDAAGYFLGLQTICRERGIPAAVYVDQQTIFQSPAKPTLEQQLNGEQPKSQFGRLADELGIELIVAHSPQAKGRVERFPLGAPCGPANEADTHRAVIRQALDVLVTAQESGTIVDSLLQWKR